MTDERLCRICGEGEEIDEPLFHPCKCTGSIRHIHEMCLVRWLSIKATGRSGDYVAKDLYSVQGMKCELCGYNFQFAPEYAPGYISGSSLGFSVGLLTEILKSLSCQTLTKSIPLCRRLGTLVIFPLLVGILTLLALTTIAQTETVMYEFPVTDVVQSWMRIYFAGCSTCIVGSTVRHQITGVARRDRSWKSMLIMGLIGIASTVLSLVIVYCTGARIAASQWSSRTTPLSDVNHDLTVLSLGLSLWFSAGCGFIALRRMYASGLAAVSASVYSGVHSVIRIVCGFIVPLAVGQSLVATSGLAPDWIFERSSTEVGTALVTTALGCVVTVPIVLIQRLFASYLMPPQLLVALDNTDIAYVLFRGRFNRESIGVVKTVQSTLVRSAVHLFVVSVAVFPAIRALHSFGTLPLSTEAQSANVASPLMLPFELFYAHVLIPLVLNTPPVPPSVVRLGHLVSEHVHKRATSLTTTTITAFMIGLVCAVFVSILLFAAGPLVIGRMVMGRDNDLMAFSVGFLAVLGTGHLLLRIASIGLRPQITGDYTPSSAPRIAKPRLVGRLLFNVASLFLLGVVALVVLPIMIGAAFQLALIIPLREFASVDHQPTPPPSAWVQILPLWIIGVMLIKILIATVTVGVFRTLKTILDTAKSQYDRHGLLSSVFHSHLYRHILYPVVRQLVLLCYLPHCLGAIAGTGDHTVLTYLVVVAVVRQGVPRTVKYVQTQREAIFNRKYLIRTKLKNFGDTDDDNTVVTNDAPMQHNIHE